MDITAKNKYIKRSKISEKKFREVLGYFCLDLTAVQTAEITRLHRNTVTPLFTKFRERIVIICAENSPIEPEKQEFEADKSYFGSRRVRGKRGRVAGSKVIVFGLYKMHKTIYF